MSQVTHPYEGHYMEAAFLGFLSFAQKDLMDQYVQECGRPQIATDTIGKMIDRATGKDVAELQKFIDWCVVQFGHPDTLGEVE